MICSERCIFSVLHKSDAESVVRLRTNVEVMRYLGGPRDETTERERFDELLNSAATKLIWAIRSSEDSDFLGIVTLTPHHDGDDTEISYLVLPNWWGHGYATEAVRTIIGHGLTELKMPRIIAETQSANIASIRLLQRVGMAFERNIERFGAEQSIYATSGLPGQLATS